MPSRSRGQIEIWDEHDFTAPVVEPVIAQVATGSDPGTFAEFVGFDAFAEHAGAPDHLQVAIELATRVEKRAILPPKSIEDYRWTLVAGDGIIAISGAVEPIEGAPDLPVVGTESS